MSRTVLLEFNLQSGRAEEFLQLLHPALAETRAREGCELVEVLIDSDNPDHILLWEKWTERKHQESYMAWRMETGLVEAIGPFVAGPPVETHMETSEG